MLRTDLRACGAAASTLQVQRVEDVHAFPGHIACDVASVSELVVPIVRDGKLIAVLDLDSDRPAAFDAGDAAALEALIRDVFGSTEPADRVL